MKNFKLLRYKILYYASFVLIVPAIKHHSNVTYLKNDIQLLLKIKNNMLSISKSQQENIKNLYFNRIDIFNTKKDHVLFKEYINYEIDLNDMFYFLTINERLAKRIIYHYKMSNSLMMEIESLFTSYNQQMNIYRQTYLAVYNKILKKYLKYPNNLLLKIYNFEDKKIW